MCARVAFAACGVTSIDDLGIVVRIAVDADSARGVVCTHAWVTTSVVTVWPLTSDTWSARSVADIEDAISTLVRKAARLIDIQ